MDNEILVGRPSDCVFSPQTLDRLYRFRYSVFAERLGWDVQAQNGQERDNFDRLNPYYVVSRNRRGGVDGCWRILPTTGPYMLRDTFPELLDGMPAPRAPDVWELSRFAVRASDPNARVQASFSALTFQLMQAVCDFAQERSVCEYVTVTSVAMERLMRQAGLPLERMGDGKAKRMGRVLTVACRIPVNQELFDAVYGATDEARKRAERVA